MSRPRPGIISALENNLPKGARLLLAVSGGKDSMALLHGCLALRRKLNLQLEVAHLDHGLRRASSGDAAFVRAYSIEQGLPCHVRRARRKPARKNAEGWGREQRYRFFRELIEKRGLDFIVTAHTANDVAETLLMRLVSNKELSGIARSDPRRRLLRPLLEVSRSTVESYVRKHRLETVEDESNRDTRLLRNKVRLRLIPYLQRNFEKAIGEILAERSEALGADIRDLEILAKDCALRVTRYPFGSRDWLRAVRRELEGLPEAVGWRLAESLVLDKLGFKIGRRRALHLATFLREGRQGFELPGRVLLRPKAGGIAIVR